MTPREHEPWFTLTYPLVAWVWWHMPHRWAKAGHHSKGQR